MDDDGEQAHLVEVAQRAAENIDVVCEDGAANLDDGELLRRDGLELREVLLDLAWRNPAASVSFELSLELRLLLTLRSKVLKHIDNGRASRCLFMTGALGDSGIAASKGRTDSCSAHCCRRHASGSGPAKGAHTRASQHSDVFRFGLVVGRLRVTRRPTCSNPMSIRGKAQQFALQRTRKSQCLDYVRILWSTPIFGPAAALTHHSPRFYLSI